MKQTREIDQTAKRKSPNMSLNTFRLASISNTHDTTRTIKALYPILSKAECVMPRFHKKK